MATAKSKAGKKAAAKPKAAPAKAVKTKSVANKDKGIPGTVQIRMYCIGTGDCFILKFFREDGSPFTMMIDCGSCQGDRKWFLPYVEDLAKHVHNHIDLLVVTHEHQDHVNGFQKCEDIFRTIDIKNAWFAWTERPDDPGGAAAELKRKRKDSKTALGIAVNEIKSKEQQDKFAASVESSPFALDLKAARSSLLDGLDSLVQINLDEAGDKAETTGAELAGLRIIKQILKEKKAKVSYLSPGTTVRIPELKGIRFHVLGPPTDRNYIYKDGKEGKDVYRKSLDLNVNSSVYKAFGGLADKDNKPDLPFSDEFVVNEKSAGFQPLHDGYKSAGNDWRNIDSEWLLSAGTLAIRLTSHINNTSLALAIESDETKRVLMMPGDAEYGSWESWHLIKNWEKKAPDGQKHFVEDLLSRTAFYKVGHHLSYNGTALEKGIRMMPESDLVAMATLDLDRISKGWKSTMPNKTLLEDIIRRTGGRFFIMNEHDVKGAPSLTLDPASLDGAIYQQKERNDGEAMLYKQYTLDF